MGLWWFVILVAFEESNAFYSQREADLVGSKYIKPQIVRDFEASKFGKSQDLYVNDLMKHHDLVRAFCQSRAKINTKKKRRKIANGSCSWRD